MAFVALAAASVTFQGVSGAIYEEAITRASSVGFVSFQDTNTFKRYGERVRIIDGVVNDTINAGDYMQLWVNSKDTGQRYFEKKMSNAVPPPRITSSWIEAGAMIQLYHFSA